MQAEMGAASVPSGRPGGPAECPGVACPPGFDGGELAWFALVALVPLAWTFLHRQPCTWAGFLSVIVHAVPLTFWAVRLRYSGQGLCWALCFPLMIGNLVFRPWRGLHYCCRRAC